jgi:hypothetical protein
MLFELMASILSAYRIRAGRAVLIFEWSILIPRIIFWLATPSYYSNHGYQFFDCLFTSARSAARLFE